MYAVDLHTHTRFFHGRRELGDRFDPVGYRLLATAARLRGLDGVATTNHDYYTAFPDVLGATALPGTEITTTRGHLLVVGPDPPAETDPGELTPEAAVEVAHDRGCAAILAHPYRNSTIRELDKLDLDAIEVNGKHPRTRSWVERLADHRGLPLVGGSDAHYPPEVGRAYTAVDAEELTPAAVVDAIRDGRVAARVDDWLPHRLLRGFYRRIHEHKRHLDSPEGPTPGVGDPPGEESD
ncbi:histidinol-phosphatase [Halobacteriales archaeon QS_9_68_42]|nr:MAG: histidinol-phosphatase [Halobacteriales archaeon QS_9_68_42]